MSLLIAAGLLVSYYILSIEVYLATYTIGTFHMSFGGFGPSELRILLSIGNVTLYLYSRVPMVRVLEMGSRMLKVRRGGSALESAGMNLRVSRRTRP
jgi:hypothetical protein